MTVVVIGLGSMGRRRIRLLKKYDSELKIIGIDTSEERRKQSEEEYGIMTAENFADISVRQEADCAFVSTSPLSHAELINTCLKNDIHVFTELNLVDTMYDENIRLAKEKDKVLFLSSTFLYRKEVEYIYDKIHGYDGKVNYLYHVGQYLPDWHPWESYKNFFVGKKETNGCREFMAIDLPWIVNVFGNVKSIKAVGDKISDLDVDYPDNYLLLIEHENGNKGTIAVDIVSRKASRNLEVFGEQIYITWDGTPQGLSWYDFEQKKDIKINMYETVDKRSDYAATIIEDAYYSEICNFFRVIAQKEKPKYSFEKDREVLKIIDYVENKVGGKS
jgi:predicted dehydrogenase